MSRPDTVSVWSIVQFRNVPVRRARLASLVERSEEHTSELQSPCNLVCRLLLEKKKTQNMKVLLLRWTIGHLQHSVPRSADQRDECPLHSTEKYVHFTRPSVAHSRRLVQFAVLF